MNVTVNADLDITIVGATKKRINMVKVGDKIRILGFQPDSDGTLPISEQKLIGKTGVVEYIGGKGELHGTWGGIAILPEDKYEVIP